MLPANSHKTVQCHNNSHNSPARSPQRIISVTSTLEPVQPKPTKCNATQPNATQPNATQRNPTQPNATQCNATQPNATQRNPCPSMPYILWKRRSTSAQKLDRAPDNHHVTTRPDFERRCRRPRRRRRRRQSGLHAPGAADYSTTSDSEMTSGRNWRLSPSPVFHLLHHHHQASYCVNAGHKFDAPSGLQLNSPASLLIDSSESQTPCQVAYMVRCLGGKQGQGCSHNFGLGGILIE